MPTSSAKQKKFMDAAAHNPAFAKKVGVPTKVAKEFSEASKGQKFKKGGEVWDKPAPKTKPKSLSPNQKAAAKAFAKKTGTRYPSLVANMHGAKAKK